MAFIIHKPLFQCNFFSYEQKKKRTSIYYLLLDFDVCTFCKHLLLMDSKPLQVFLIIHRIIVVFPIIIFVDHKQQIETVDKLSEQIIQALSNNA